MKRTWLVLTACLGVLAACSSTAQRQEARTADLPTDTTVAGVESEAAAPAPTIAGSAPTIVGEETLSALAPQPPGSGTTVAAPVTTAAPGGTPAPTALRAGPVSQGVTAASITVGIRVLDENATKAFAVAYGLNAETPDMRGYAEAMVAHINATGGMAGRRLAPVYHQVDTQGLVANPSASDQTSCSAFTEDAKVFAVASLAPGGASLLPECLATKNTPLIQDNINYFDRARLQRLAGFVYLPVHADSTRLSKFWVDGLHKLGYFSPGARVGLLWYRDPSGTYERTVKDGLKPALASRRIAIADEVVLASYTNSTEFAGAVLRMKTNDVSHVIILDVSSLMSLNFMTNAETQGYRPRYGLNTTSALVFLQTNVPREQLRGTAAVGWMPTFDVDGTRGPAHSRVDASCLDIMRKAGKRVTSRIAETLAFWACDTIQFLDTIVDRAAGLNPAALRSAAEQLGDGYAPPGTFAARFGRGRYDGVSAVRNVTFVDACNCFAYAGPTYSVG
jgi:hypothetical protein